MPTTTDHISGSTAIGRPVRALAGCVVVALLASSCQDAEDHPLALAVATETHGAVVLDGGPATVPRLLAEHGLEREGALESGAWLDSWDMGYPKGEALREQIYPSAARLLAARLGPSGIQDLLERNSLTLASVGALTSVFESKAISTSLSAAWSHHSKARSALHEGQGEKALLEAFRASDALWELSPPRVAEDLIARAEEALRRKPEPGPYSEEELIRIRRLMYGASEALAAGDYPGAIRRAYYACQLLGADPP